MGRCGLIAPMKFPFQNIALIGKHKAGDLVKKVAAVCGGSGGGKPEMATAGGKDAGKVDAALEELLKLIETERK